MSNEMKDWCMNTCQDYVLYHHLLDSVLSVETLSNLYLVQGFKNQKQSTVKIPRHKIFKYNEE